MKTLVPKSLLPRAASPFQTSACHRYRFLFFSRFSDEVRFLSSSSHSSPARRQHEEESRNVKVSVWWDFENCSVPAGVNVFRVGQRIIAALRANGIRGPVMITAFGDVSQLSRLNQEALTSTGICLAHVPHCGKNSADRSLLLDLVSWVSQNPPPAHLFLISGDRDFANILHRLRMNNYNILLASTDCATGVLCSAASIMWHWNTLIRGENLNGKHYNHPPDGSYGSWYGHCKGTLDDPFSGGEQTQQAALLPSENSSESGTDVKPRPIPKAFVRNLRQILNLYPNGVGLPELRTELAKTIAIDKDFFGHKTFSRLLLSLPNVLKLKFRRHPSGDNQVLVYGVSPKATDASASTLKPTIVSDADGDATSNPPTNELANSNLNVVSNGASQMPSDQVKNANSPTHGEIGTRKENDSTISQQHNSTFSERFFGRIWKPWFGYKTVCSNEEADSEPSKCSTSRSFQDAEPKFKSCIGSEKRQQKGECSHCQSTNHQLDLVPSNPRAPPGESKSSVDERTSEHSELNHEKSSSYSGFRSLFAWLMFWKARKEHPLLDSEFAERSTKNDVESSVSISQMKDPLEDHHLFSKPYFWSDLESFFQTRKGAALISQSLTREHLAKELKNKGPLIVRALNNDDFHLLVDVLISKKQWIEESEHLTFPFKVKLPAKLSNQQQHKGESTHFLNESPIIGSASNEQPQNIDELKAWYRKICSGTGAIEADIFKRHFEREFSRELDCSAFGFPSLESLLMECSADDNYVKSYKKPSYSKFKIETDCKKLAVEMLQEHPEGFNISSFDQLFRRRYGYDLDHQKLGHSTVKSLLLKIMSGVKIKRDSVLTLSKVRKEITEGQSCKENFASIIESELGKKNDTDDEITAFAGRNGYQDSQTDSDSPWEELGPVAKEVHQGNDNKSGHVEVGPGQDTSICKSVGKSKQSLSGDMVLEKPSCSDDELTDLDEEIITSDSKIEDKSTHVEGSSLLNILNSWHDSKGRDTKDDTVNIDGLVDCSRDNASRKLLESFLNSSDKPHLSTRSRAKLQSRKNYSFVSDSAQDGKDKLVDGILGNLRKPADSRLQS